MVVGQFILLFTNKWSLVGFILFFWPFMCVTRIENKTKTNVILKLKLLLFFKIGLRVENMIVQVYTKNIPRCTAIIFSSVELHTRLSWNLEFTMKTCWYFTVDKTWESQPYIWKRIKNIIIVVFASSS